MAINVITKVLFIHFEDLIILGRISDIDRDNIIQIRKTMSLSEYAGYAPKDQAKYASVKQILSKYEQVVIFPI